MKQQFIAICLIAFMCLSSVKSDKFQDSLKDILENYLNLEQVAVLKADWKQCEIDLAKSAVTLAEAITSRTPLKIIAAVMSVLNTIRDCGANILNDKCKADFNDIKTDLHEIITKATSGKTDEIRPFYDDFKLKLSAMVHDCPHVKEEPLADSVNDQ